MGKRLGLLRAIYLVSASCMGSFAFAFDTGVISGVLTLESFQRDFGYTQAQKTTVNSNAVSILQAGAFFGCFFTTPVASRLGRRSGLILSSLIFTVGTVLQVINAHTLGTFYAGRVIAGVGIGAATVLIPMYAAEMSPKEFRGRLGACFQWFFALGVMVAYWVTYAVSRDQPSATKQWQIALGLQLLPSTLLLAGMCTVRESARWLATQGRTEAAWDSLRWVRGGEETAELRAEFDEILRGIEEETRVREHFTWRELLLPANRYRLFIAVTIQLCAQLSGNTSLAYYATQIFAAVGAGSSATLVTGFFGVVKVLGVTVFQLFVMDRIGRRVPFMVGAGAMGSFMLIIACVLATHPTPSTMTTTTGTTPAGIAMIIMTYAEAFSFNMSWGPLPWLYVGEIFSSRTREVGVTVGAASQWLFNFMMSQVTPHAISNIGWRMFLMFAIFNYAIIGYSWAFLRETSQHSLEEMQNVFGGGAAAAGEASLDKRLEEEPEPTRGEQSGPAPEASQSQSQSPSPSSIQEQP
ncbi:putative MFS sugar transporter [Aspergillus clavatus NRRL 1]|uniref:MFS sugar transporter, putative n=1 Tax=Aspergillus clavatus (strain ATCC 1007 / CBS 513.65 / DSM 816 / NCTC 3887 / NRRL 1 / QM 1276 / 107) TaxID=344612 RepID=A1CEL3_ASPCL|nr:MFS sugar transporter, putative [Aspergillus clavatus NRRL 1]EAW11312.1 MFS sugar transporter, putative [Aspergillus clavatus NRRL 1]